MWKVVIIICMFGYDYCQLFEQKPIQFYHDYNECISIAIEKKKLLTTAYKEHGYQIIDSKATCKQHLAT